jgi:hypothetical protein
MAGGHQETHIDINALIKRFLLTVDLNLCELAGEKAVG